MMAIHLDLTTQEEIQIFQIFAPYSIHAELLDDSGTAVAGLEDEGSSGWALLTQEEAEQMPEPASTPAAKRRRTKS